MAPASEARRRFGGKLSEGQIAGAAVARVPAAGLVPWLAVAMGCGAAGYLWWPTEPPVWLGGAGVLTAAVVAWLAPGRWLVAAVLAGGVAFGVFSGQMRVLAVATPVLADEMRAVAVTGTVTAAERRGGRLRLVLDAVTIDGLSRGATPRRVRVTATGDLLPRPGDLVRLRATLGPPPGPVAPGAFDFGRALFFQGIGGTGFAFGAPLVVGGGEGAWRSIVARVRQGVASRVTDALPGDRGAVAAALLSGDRGGIGADAIGAMRAAGLAHLLAISGLHMGLVAGLVMVAVRGGLAWWPGLAAAMPIKKWAAAAAMVAGLGYLLLAGAPVPTQRAFIMTVLVLTAVIVDRSAISMRLVGLAALVILALRPESVVGASFQMSFAAVVALVAFYEGLAPRLAGIYSDAGVGRRLGLYFAGVAATTVVASLATLPLVWQAFNTVALYGLAANLVAVPLTALWIMPWGLVALALMPVGLEVLALVPMGWGIGGVLTVAETVAGWPGSTVTVAPLPIASFVVVVGGGLALCLGRHWWRLRGVAAIAGGLATAPLTAAPDIVVTERLVSVRGDGELLVSDGRRGAFARGIWLRRAGLTEWRRFGDTEAGGNWRLGCDAGGCSYTASGTTVALSRDPQSLAEDCSRAALVVDLSGGTTRCGDGTPVIGVDDIAEAGAFGLWVEPDGVTATAANARRAGRPWGSGGAN